MFYAIRTLGPIANPFARPEVHAFADAAARDAFVAVSNSPLSAYEAAEATGAEATAYAAARPVVRHG